MKESRNQISIPVLLWNCLYPILIYYMLILIVEYMLIYIFRWVDPGNRWNLSGNFPLIQLLYSIVIIPVMLYLYMKDQDPADTFLKSVKEHLKIVPGAHNNRMVIKNILFLIGSAAAVLLIGFGLNNVLAMTPLIQLSKGFQTATKALYSGGIAEELLSSALMIPILEELVFRGIVYHRLRARVSAVWSVLLSSLFFGLMHANLVQLTYTFLLGMVLALIVEKSKKLYPAIAGHIVVNAFSIARSECSLFQEMVNGTAQAWAVSVLSLVSGIVLCVILFSGQLVDEAERPEKDGDDRGCDK